MNRYYYQRENADSCRGTVESAIHDAMSSISVDAETGELCVTTSGELPTDIKGSLDYNMERLGYTPARSTANRKPRAFSDIVTAVDAFLDTNAKIKAAVVRLVALAIREKQPADHVFGAIDGTEPE